MQESTINSELVNVDLSKIAAIQQKRTLAFINHFVLTNVQFLNNFMKQCESRLMQFERKLEKVTASMVLLESKLSSIPELNTITESKGQSKENSSVSEEKLNDSSDESKNPERQPLTEIKEKVAQPEYDRFVKMVQVGVPLQAVKLKVAIEGLNPDVFEAILNK